MRAGPRKSISMRRTTQTILSPCLPLSELGVVDAGEPQIVGAPALEEFEIARVVDDAGEIGVGVVDARHQPVPERQSARRKARPRATEFTMIVHCAFLFGAPDRSTGMCGQHPDGTVDGDDQDLAGSAAYAGSVGVARPMPQAFR